jgi:23S rRNA (adenine2503-C2)-methyltransferase
MRNLNPDEIVDQVTTIHKQSLLYFDRPLSNIVFMGMGEPLMNYNNVMKAVEKITDPETIGMSPKRITISTSGVSKMIVKMADDQVRCKLAISLHSAIEEIRNKIMPFTTKFPLQDLKAAIAYWYEKTGSRVTYEYVVWKGINDRQMDVNALVDFCKATPSKVNLIEYNPTDNDAFMQASQSAIDMYITTLERNRIPVTVRRSRGKDIDAACGQLANKKVMGG